MALVQQRLHHDADRVGEVHEPGSPGAAALRLFGDLEHDGNGAESLGETSGTGRLLADAAELQRHRLVDKPRRLATHPELDDHKARAVERAGAVLRGHEPARPLLLLKDAPSQAADDLQPLVIDVVKHQLVDWQPVAAGLKTFDELWGVSAAAADDRNLYAHCAASYARICGNC